MASKVFTDQMNRKVEIPISASTDCFGSAFANRTAFCISDLNDRVTGITKFCIHPNEWFQTKTRIGGTKKLHLDQIREMQPDLIIANKEENTQAEIEQLAQEFPVWISDIHNLDDACNMILSIGEICNRQSESSEIVQQITSEFNQLNPLIPSKRAIYLIWNEPYMAINSDTFIHEMMLRCGFENCTANHSSRYPEISLDEVKSLQPEVILLSSEPFPFSAKHQAEIQAQFPSSQVILVDGEFFSWYGSRLVQAASIFSKSCCAEIA
jgi:ABC-type Fe3+-hydroxamate transport system substrate-binding protein